METERTRFRNTIVRETLTETLEFKIPETDESAWMSAFWAMQLIQFTPEGTTEKLSAVVSGLEQYSPAFQRSVLEFMYALLPGAFEDEINSYLQHTRDPKLFAMAVHYLLLKKDHPERFLEFRNLLHDTFPDAKDNPILLCLDRDLEAGFNHAGFSMPPLEDLLTMEFGANKPVVFSFQRKDRRYPGMTVIRLNNGTWLRRRTGGLFHIQHLACSVTGLPEYITNGNSPQGIYAIKGVDVSENVFIGPTPNLQLRMPFESSVAEFFHSAVPEGVRDWNRDIYRDLLPESWKSYHPVYGTFHAGQAGRTEIIAHGTTINPDYYHLWPCYPLTPSLGCLTAMELWSPRDGRCLASDQLALINAYNRTGGGDGYFVLVEINDKKHPVWIGEMISLLLKTEQLGSTNAIG